MTVGTSTHDHRLPEHLEGYLGSISKGLSSDGFSIVRFKGEISGGVPYATLGLSNLSLPPTRSAKTIRHELLMLLPADVRTKHAAAVLEWVARNVIREQRPLLSGEVINSSEPLFPKSEVRSLYVTSPVYLPDDFAAYHDPAGTIIIAWLVPILQSEADFVNHQGWSQFEDLLESRNPNLVDIYRSPIV